MAKSHVWLAPTTGSKGRVLRKGQPFNPSDHDYLDLDQAIEDGKAEVMEEEEEKMVATDATLPVPAAQIPPPVEPLKRKRGKR